MAIGTPYLFKGKWCMRVQINGHRLCHLFETEEEAIAWAIACKKSQGKLSESDLDKYGDSISDAKGFILDDRKSTPHSAVPSIKRELKKIDSMTGLEFENKCANLLKLSNCFKGGTINTTKGQGDFGADIIVQCLDGTRIAIQCKRTQTNVPIDAVQEVYSSMAHYKASVAAVMTNSNFTPAAKKLAKDSGVYLIDREGIIRLLQLYINTYKMNRCSNQWEILINEMDNVQVPKKNELED